MIEVKKGSTDQTFYVFFGDSADGTPETGLTITDIDITYIRNQDTYVKADATALTAADDAHTDNYAFEVDATQAPGIYRIDFPDAAFATAADKVILAATCAGCSPCYIHCRLVDFDSQDGVRIGLTAMPNAAADAAGGLPVSDAGGLDLDALNTAVADVLTDTGTTLPGTLTTITGYVDLIDDGTSGLAKIAADVAAILVDTDATIPGTITTLQADTDDIQARLPAALVGGMMDANLGAIGGSTVGVAGLDRAARSIVLGTVAAGSTTTSIVTSSLTPAASVVNQFVGLIVKFAQDTTTAALRGQATDITGSTALGVLAVTALTDAPVSGDTFTIE